MASAATAIFPPRPASIGDFFALLKPRVMSLVIFTGLAGIVVAPGGVHPLTAFTALLCIAVGAGASGALNMAYDSDIDRLMARTASRPIPTGRVGRARMRWPSAGPCRWAPSRPWACSSMPWRRALLAFTIFFYVVVYTLWLKRRTAQNIVIGGLAGALPPAIGWAAVTGEPVDRAAHAGARHLPVDAAAFLGAVACGAPTIMRAPACRCCRS